MSSYILMNRNLTLIRNILIIVILACTGCKKADIPLFEGENALYFQGGAGIYPKMLVEQSQKDNTLSFNYNFAYRPDSRTRDTISIPIWVAGFSTSSERPINIGIVKDSTTATVGLDFELLPTSIKSNRVSDSVQIVLIRTSRLSSSVKSVSIKIMPNEFFPRYMYLDSVNVYNQAKITFTDLFTKPADWDGIYSGGDYYPGYGLGRQLGEYSEVKFRLVIDVFGTANILPRGLAIIYDYRDDKPTGYFTATIWRNYMQVLQQRLVDYRLANGHSMLDEKGKVITFPPFSDL